MEARPRLDPCGVRSAGGGVPVTRDDERDPRHRLVVEPHEPGERRLLAARRTPNQLVGRVQGGGGTGAGHVTVFVPGAGSGLAAPCGPERLRFDDTARHEARPRTMIRGGVTRPPSEAGGLLPDDVAKRRSPDGGGGEAWGHRLTSWAAAHPRSGLCR